MIKQERLIQIKSPEDCPYLDRVNRQCGKKALITCREEFAELPYECPMKV